MITKTLYIDDVHPGWKTRWKRPRITLADLEHFVNLSGDRGGYHTDPAFARAAGFKDIITPGMLQVSMFTKVGGDMNILGREMHFHFLRPVYVGDDLEVELVVLEVEKEKNLIAIRAEITNQEGETVLTVEGRGHLPKREWGSPVKTD